MLNSRHTTTHIWKSGLSLWMMGCLLLWGAWACSVPERDRSSVVQTVHPTLFSADELQTQSWDFRIRLWQQALSQEGQLPVLWQQIDTLLHSIHPLSSLFFDDMLQIATLSIRQQRWLSVLMPSFGWEIREQTLGVRIWVAHQGAPGELQSLGMQIIWTSDSIKHGWIPVQSLTKLAKIATVSAVELSTPLRLHMNVSGPAIQAPSARLQYGLDGRGVILGFIDTGIDYQHPAFQNPDGTTRILAILDFSVDSPITEKPPHVYQQEQINESLRSGQPLGHKDTLGHGTHVAGIAAGNGRISNRAVAPYLGVAPRADLVVVKGLRSESQEFDSGDVLQGIAFVHAVARRTGKPYAINLSLGGQQGGHDGYSLLERALSTYSGPGKPGQILVASAGNEGQSPIHAGGWLQEDYPLQVEFMTPTSTLQTVSSAQVVIEFWIPQDSAVRLSLRSPDGGSVASFAFHDPPKSPQELPNAWVALAYGQQSLPTPSQHLAITISQRESRPFPAGVWSFRLEGRAVRWDAWISEAQIPGGGTARWQTYQSADMLIGIPASADAVISVGSFNTRSGWQDQAGDVQQRGFIPGQLSTFSSPGPTRDGRPKPELVAPGLFIVAPVSQFAKPAPSSQVGEGLYQISQGTSQAAPHVTGGMALLLQAQPKLDTQQVRHILMKSSVTDEFTGGAATYQKGWGFGKLDLLQALHTLKHPSQQPPDPILSKLGVIYESLPADGRSQTSIFIIPKDRDGTPTLNTQKIEVHSTFGTLSEVTLIAPGLYHATLTAPDVPGVSPITATIDGVILHTMRVITFWPANQPPSSSSGCQCQTQTGFFPPVLIFLITLGICFGMLVFRGRFFLSKDRQHHTL